MKIVILGPAHPYRGGIAALNDRLAVELIKEGHEVTVFNFSLQYPKFLFPGKTQYTDDPAPRNVTILRKVNAVNPLNWWKVGRELRRLRPELIIVRFWLPFMGPALGTVCRIARRNKYTKVICIADNIIPHEKRIGDVPFTSYFVKGVDGFIAMSQEVFKDLEKFVPHPVRRFAPHPVYDHYGEIIPREVALAHLKLDAKFRYLLFFGFIREYKGLDILLEAMADQRIREQHIRLIVAGEFYGNADFYQKLIEQYGIEDLLVMHTDYIPSEVMNDYFCGADLVVQPYRSATQSGVTQVGYHFDKPMLVSNVGGLAEIVADGKSGYVVEPQSWAIADAIIDFYVNERAESYRTETRKLKQKFSWTNLTRNIFEIYDELKNN
ncbi:glycosyltransferase [Culturomica massiliensis]|uniref:glycosyltransferase n=1 Tax=Culturomica massiliensis TaxID=1841857 RepID=UPI0026702100|nr:glycosyltransferase [Culturomica massiliensis]